MQTLFRSRQRDIEQAPAFMQCSLLLQFFQPIGGTGMFVACSLNGSHEQAMTLRNRHHFPAQQWRVISSGFGAKPRQNYAIKLQSFRFVHGHQFDRGATDRLRVEFVELAIDFCQDIIVLFVDLIEHREKLFGNDQGFGIGRNFWPLQLHPATLHPGAQTQAATKSFCLLQYSAQPQHALLSI